MKFSVPHNALVLIADGTHATYYSNTGTADVKIEKVGMLSSNVNDGKGPARLPNETTPHEKNEANFAKHIADDLYNRFVDKKISAFVIVADPQTLGQIRPNLHKEVAERITGELHKTLTKSTLEDIQKILMSASN